MIPRGRVSAIPDQPYDDSADIAGAAGDSSRSYFARLVEVSRTANGLNDGTSFCHANDDGNDEQLCNRGRPSEMVFSRARARETNMQSLRWPAIWLVWVRLLNYHARSALIGRRPATCILNVALAARSTLRSSPGASTGEPPPDAGLGPNHLLCMPLVTIACRGQPSSPSEPVPEAVSHPENTGPRGSYGGFR